MEGDVDRVDVEGEGGGEGEVKGEQVRGHGLAPMDSDTETRMDGEWKEKGYRHHDSPARTTITSPGPSQLARRTLWWVGGSFTTCS